MLKFSRSESGQGECLRTQCTSSWFCEGSKEVNKCNKKYQRLYKSHVEPLVNPPKAKNPLRIATAKNSHPTRINFRVFPRSRSSAALAMINIYKTFFMAGQTNRFEESLPLVKSIKVHYPNESEDPP